MPAITDMLPDDWDEWSIEDKTAFLHALKYDWKLWARPEQYQPGEDWDICLVLAGRGAGKSRMGSEWIRQKAESRPGARIALVGPTYAAVRDVQVEGDSGLLNVCPPGTISKWNKSLGQLTFTNGSKAFSYSGNDPEKFRGPQHDFAWVDELCAMQYASETWDMMLMGLRLGAHPQIMITTTPKPIPIIIELVQRSQTDAHAVRIVRGSTFDNAANLPASTLAALRARYEGTHLGRQELYADLILDAPGALWQRSLFDAYRIDPHGDKPLPDMVKIVVAVDPGLSTTTERMTETGIVVAGLGSDRRGYILADLSEERPSPDTWAKIVVNAYKTFRADRIVAEVNNGGDLVEHTIRTVDPKVPYKKVYASRGKQTRAEPISALYEQGRVSHVGTFHALEDQMCAWVPGDPSPDRMDAVVWALTEIMLGGGIGEIYVPDERQLGRVPIL
jgi:phage terminase large subunit-like protein